MHYANDVSLPKPIADTAETCKPRLGTYACYTALLRALLFDPSTSLSRDIRQITNIDPRAGI